MKPGALLALIAMLLSSPAMAGEVLRIGTYAHYPPWTISGKDGVIRGFEIDMIDDLCPRMGVRCTVAAVPWERVFDDLDAGAYDLYIGGMAATEERARRVDFSLRYAEITVSFMTVAGHPLTSALSLNRISLDRPGERIRESLRDLIQELRGRRLGVHLGTTLERFADSYLEGVAELRRYDSEQAQYEDLLAGRLDAVLASSPAAYEFVTANRWRPVPPVLFGPVLAGGLLGQGVAAALRRGDDQRLARLNAALAAARADGTLARLSLKWFGYNVAPE